MSGDIALYVHFPFCRRKCHYCSFISYEKREADILSYVEAVKQEMRLRSHGERLGSIYLGGGTPSLLPPESVSDLFAAINRIFILDKNAEITMEANPGTINETYLNKVKKCGINRLSLGVQSFNDDELKILGRIHSANEAKQAIKFARNVGFDNLNLDLIYGLPGQSEHIWRSNLEEALALGLDHLSLYALTLEEDSPLRQTIAEGSLPAIDPDLTADLYELSEDILKKAGYIHYEISNWAKKGRECRHNLVYWKNLPYMGVGVAAHSFLEGHRLANTNNLDKYLKQFNRQPSWQPEMDEIINLKLELAETVILGLRLIEGINKAAIRHRFGIDITEYFSSQIKEMTAAGLLKQNDGNISLTNRGRLLSNQVFYRFLPE